MDRILSLPRRSRVAAAAGAVALALAIHTSAHSQELGSITFPTSGAPAAQAAFLEGVKALHSFEFDSAAVAFQRAQKADPVSRWLTGARR